ncbi:MAG: 2OG-Fe(II) oxygenase [Gemmobacter sp.]
MSYLFQENALPAAECDLLVTLAAQAEMADAGLVGKTTSHALRRAEVVWLDDLPQAAPVMDRLIRLVAQANRETFDVDLTEFAESAQIARYGAEREGHFGWHSDIGKGTLAVRRKLTLVIQLSDPAGYDGGALELRPDANVAVAPRTRGTAAIFPAYVLHRVSPVTRGTRWSLTLWAHGPAYR